MRLAILVFLAATSVYGQSLPELTDARDYELVVRTFDALSTPTHEERALYVEALTNVFRTVDAAPIAESLMKDAPSSPWAWYARAALEGASHRVDDALATTGKMLELAGPDPDDLLIRYRVDHLQYFNRFSEALALLDSRPASPALRIVRGLTMSVLAQEKSQPEDGVKALALLQAVADENPDSVPALYALTFQLQVMQRFGEAHAAAKRLAAMTLSPFIHSFYWSVLATAPGLSEGERRAELEQDAASLIKTRGHEPGVWLRIARGYERLDATEVAEEWRSRVVRDAAEPPEAATALYERYLAFITQNRDAQNDPKLRAKAVQLARDVLAHPRLVESFRDSLSLRLLSYLDADPDTSTEDLLAALDSARRIETDMSAAVQASLLLSNRSLRPEQAQKLARIAIEKANVMSRNGMVRDESNANYLRAIAYDALGWALLKSGDLVSAHTQLLAAVELAPKFALAHYHLGQWYEVSGERDLAEKSYVRGMAQQSRTLNPNEAALTKLRGAAAVKKGRATGAERRRKTILASRIAAPASAPPFRLERIDGKPVSLASLKGKVVVVNFWGIWCGYCVEELPEVQELARKYAGNSEVVVLTINNDGNPDKVRKWMRGKKFDFPVLIDGGFAQGEKVRSWPTTWFIDQRGRMAFLQEGWTEHLLEEFSWRIDAMITR
ncbi:MAG TPA: redoxin domain-containing protein [Thermoanaerobaculia bacterium]|nr:redoxin domain-containing protein [Thermoanaerobaculia bacterium]